MSEIKKAPSQTLGLGTSEDSIKSKNFAKQTIVEFINKQFTKSNRKPTSSDVLTFVFSKENGKNLKEMLLKSAKPLKKGINKIFNKKIDAQVEALLKQKVDED